MKRLLLFTFTIFIALTACQSRKEHDHTAAKQDAGSADTVKKSIPKEAHAMIGNAHITIHYTAPVVKGRVIWGGLVAYDQVWVTGAHRATTMEVSQDFVINEKTIPGGKYAIFTLPGKDNWKFIVNKKWDQHLADEYNEAEDVVRVDVTPEVTDFQERLLYDIVKQSETAASLNISWEKLRISVPITFQQ
jgi:hypothetical protein